MTVKPARTPTDLEIDLQPDGGRRHVADLHRHVRESILSGRLAPGLRLPSTRAFARQHGVSRNTAARLYDILTAEGLVVARHGSGTFVAACGRSLRPADPALPVADPRLPRDPPSAHLAAGAPMLRPEDLDLRIGVVDQSMFPWEVWRRLTLRVMREHERKPSIFVPAAGHPPLRAAIAGHVSFARAVACEPDDIVVTDGAQQAFDLLARALVVPGRTVVAVEDPGYVPARAAFVAAGAVLAPVPVDAEGLIVEAVPPAARVLFVTPSHQFPTGVPMSLRRRRAIVELAARTGAVIIEDDYDCEFRYEAHPLDALKTLDRSDSIVYVGTFSKTMFPGVRMGFVVTPRWLRDAIVAYRRIAGFTGSTIQQLALAPFITEGHLARHVRRMRRVYAERRSGLIAALQRHCGDVLSPIPSSAGLHVAARLTGGATADDVMDAARAANIVFERLDAYALTDADPAALAFGFGTTDPERIDDAMQALANALRESAGRTQPHRATV